MCPVCGLCVHSGVPVVIVEDDRIGLSEGDAEPTCPSTEEEGEDIFIILKVIDHVSSVGNGTLAVESKVMILFPAHVVFQNIEHPSHLAKNKDSPLFGP